MPSLAAEACQFCGNKLAVGAVACYRCGKMVERPEADTSGSGALPTQLGTQAKGELLGEQWRLVKPIGQGAVGVVWQAHDVTLDRTVAVKVMHERLVSDATAVARFERESRVLAKLEHPNIVPVWGVGMLGARPFLVMKQLEGRTLAEHLHTRGGRLTPAEAVPLLSQLSDALDFVHGTHVVHRDLKPSNVFIGVDGHVWLLDLGLAFEPGSDLTHSGDVLGAVQYLSPEQLVGRGDIDARSDVFSLACLAFEMFVGHTPFVGEPRDVLAHQLHSLPPDASTLVSELPKAVGALLRRAMAKSPLERPSSAGDFAQSLRDLFGLAADGTVSGVGAPPLVLPRTRDVHALPPEAERPTQQAPETPREGATVPLEDPSGTLSEAVSGTPTPLPSADPGGTLVGDDGTSIVSLSSIVAREGPTGPTARTRAQQLKRAGIGLGALTFAVAAVLGVALLTRPPAPDGPSPVPRPVGERVVQVNPPTADMVDMNSVLAPEPPKIPSVTSVEPGQETYKPISYSRFKEVRPRHVNVKSGRSGSGQPELEVKVFSPESEGRKELKADVVLDDQRKGLSPLTLHLRPGQHVLQISSRPYPMTEMQVSAFPNSKQVVEIELLPPGSETWAPEATVDARAH